MLVVALFFITFYSQFLCACHTHVEVKEQFEEIGSLLPPCELWGLNLGQSDVTADVFII